MCHSAPQKQIHWFVCCFFSDPLLWETTGSCPWRECLPFLLLMYLLIFVLVSGTISHREVHCWVIVDIVPHPSPLFSCFNLKKKKKFFRQFLGLVVAWPYSILANLPHASTLPPQVLLWLDHSVLLAVARFPAALLQQGGEHGAGAEGPLPHELDGGTAAASGGQPGGVQPPLPHHQALRRLPVPHQWYSVGSQASSLGVAELRDGFKDLASGILERVQPPFCHYQTPQRLRKLCLWRRESCLQSITTKLCDGCEYLASGILLCKESSLHSLVTKLFDSLKDLASGIF